MVSFNPYIRFNSSSKASVLSENPYICECGTFLTLRARVKQMQESGRLMYEYKKAFAHSMVMDDRMLENDEFSDYPDDNFDVIDALNAVDSLSAKEEQFNAEKRDLNANNSVVGSSDSKNINEAEKVVQNASERVGEPTSKVADA